MRQIPPNAFINFGYQKAKSGVHNPHFWAIASIMAFLILFYNASYLGIASWFPWFADVVMAQGFYAFVLTFLFLVPLIYAAVVFRLRGFLITWAIFVVAILPRTLQQSSGLESLMRVALFTLVALLLGLLVALVYNPEAKEDALRLAKGGRRISLARVLKVQEYERQHVSRELHDKIIQTLLVIANRAHALGAGDSGELTPEARKQAEQLVVMLLLAVDDVRRLSRDLRPSILDNVGLLPSLRWLTEQTTQESGIKAEVKVNGLEHRLRPELEVVVFRIAQEALSNVARHSRASKAVVTLDFVASDFKMTVEDNGQGFCLPEKIGDYATKGKLGLARIEQQARLLEGTFDIRSEPGEGTVITVEAKT
jgi:two-component system sensor histidine kinase DegS